MRAPFVIVPILVLVLLVVACQGKAGPAGPAGPPGESASLDEAAIADIIEQQQAQAAVPPKWEPAEYTKYFVKAAINKYNS